MKRDSELDAEGLDVVHQNPQNPDQANETKARWRGETAGTTNQRSGLTNGAIQAVQKSFVDTMRQRRVRGSIRTVAECSRVAVPI